MSEGNLIFGDKSPLHGQESNISNNNNTQPVNKECETKNTGDYCFTNSTQKQLKVYLYTKSEEDGLGGNMIETGKGGYMRVKWNGGDVTIEPGQTECFYNIPAYSLDFDVRDPSISWNATYTGNVIRNGHLMAEKCKSKTYVIK